MKLTYRPEIDGLRSIAVLPVMLFHGGISGFSGGFVGVDVFFVISGYLITSLILSEMEMGRFSLLDFYERRARRILPALFFVIICCLPIAWSWMLPADLRDFGQSIVAVLLFVSNFFFYQDAGYFGPAVELLPLIHTWSLAVEEQFYVLFPLLLLLVYRGGTKLLFLVLSAIALLSLLLSGLLTGVEPNFSFYLLPMRAWELFAGALVACYLLRNGQVQISASLRNVCALSGLLMIMFAIAYFDDSTVFPGWAALIPVLGTVLIILFAQAETWVNNLLRMRPLVFIGLISYSAYLWHQPLFAFARLRSFENPTAGIFVLLTLCSLVLAWISWRYIESPFRNRQRISRPLVFKSAAYSMLVLMALGVSLNVNSGFASRLPEAYRQTAEYAYASNPRENDCDSATNGISLNNACLYGDTSNVTFAVWGDSHSNGLAYSLGNALLPRDVGLVEYTFSACPPARGLLRPSRIDQCAEFNEQVSQAIIQNSAIEVVVLVARWSLYLEGTAFDNHEGGRESVFSVYAVPQDQPDLELDSDTRRELVAQLYLDQIQALMDAGKQVVLVHPVPEAGWDVPRYLMREIQFGIEREDFLSTGFARYQERHRLVLAAFSGLPESMSLVQIKPQSIFCNVLLPNRCVVQDGVGPLYSDSNHLTVRGTDMIAEEIMAALQY